jgi:hypothetical protein
MRVLPDRGLDILNGGGNARFTAYQAIWYQHVIYILKRMACIDASGSLIIQLYRLRKNSNALIHLKF